jgi:parvulin-like peptidyl-prolyl isomerase
MAKVPNPFKKKKKIEQPRPERITNETVAEHREQILAGGRRFKYPMQYARIRLIRNTVIIAVVTILSLSAVTWWQLYSAQTTNKIFYRVSEIFRLPVANVDGENVAYSYYLLELRSSIHFLSGKNTNFNSDDGKRQLLYQKRLAMNKATTAAYATKLAKENNITVSDKEINDFITRTLNESNLSTNQDVYSRAIKDYYGWEYDEFKTSLRYKLLARKVAQAIDTNAKQKAQSLAEQLKVSGADFVAIAKQNSDEPGAAQSGGDQGFIPKTSQDANGLVATAARLQPGQISGVIAGTDGYYIIKLAESNAEQVRYSQIFVSFKEFNTRLAALRDKNQIKEYISVPNDVKPVSQ